MPQGNEPVTKAEAIRRLRAAGFVAEAGQLDAWRNIIGNDGGWDGWVRRAYPEAVDVIWQ